MDLQEKSKITCELFSCSNWGHLQQLYTGFSLLHRRGVIQLAQRIRKKDLIDGRKPPHLRDAKRSHLKVLVNGDRVIYYDCHDSFEIDTEALSKADFYFKRSYSDREVGNSHQKHKIFPLGLNVVVYNSYLDISLLKRTNLQPGIEKLRNLLIGIGLDRVFSRIYVDRVENLELYPRFNLPPKVLFMARAWNPEIAKSKEKHEEIESINTTRAQCIRLLKKEFGNRFLGGFTHDNYSLTKYRDCLVADKSTSPKKNYMRLLRDFPICVATTGLHGSIAWKVGEYVSQAKAIVTERLNYRVPGYFQSGENYLDFVSAEDCVEACVKLFNDQETRCQLMINNYRYYHSHLRPDSLVLNTLATAMSSQRDKASNRPIAPSLTAFRDDTAIRQHGTLV